MNKCLKLIFIALLIVCTLVGCSSQKFQLSTDLDPADGVGRNIFEHKQLIDKDSSYERVVYDDSIWYTKAFDHYGETAQFTFFTKGSTGGPSHYYKYETEFKDIASAKAYSESIISDLNHNFGIEEGAIINWEDDSPTQIGASWPEKNGIVASIEVEKWWETEYKVILQFNQS